LFASPFQELGLRAAAGKPGDSSRGRSRWGMKKQQAWIWAIGSTTQPIFSGFPILIRTNSNYHVSQF